MQAWIAHPMHEIGVNRNLSRVAPPSFEQASPNHRQLLWLGIIVWLLLVGCLVFLLGGLDAEAYDPLEGLTPVKFGLCATREGRQPCAVMVKEQEPDNIYLVIFDDEGKTKMVIRHSNQNGKQEIVYQADDKLTKGFGG